MAEARPKDHFGLICLVLVLVTAALYWPITNHPFILYDDEQYVTINPHVTTGLNWTNFVWAFKNVEAANWHPLTWLSHQLDCTLFGLKAGAHHFVNLLFHIANTLLLLIFLRNATGALWRPALVAAFFAWHPLHVESVAWASERKDMLSTFFWLLTLLAWLRYAGKQPGATGSLARGGKWRAYVLALVFFALGLLSKPMVVTLPFVLLLLDFWPLDRLTFDAGSVVEWKWLILEKLPFFALAGAGSLATYLVQSGGGAVWGMSLNDRLANVLVGYARYVIKLIWPTNLAILYSPPGHWPFAVVAGAAVLLLACTILTLVYWRRHPYLLLGWFWFVGTLVPTIGIVQVGAQSMADRYTYIPSIGFFMVLVWGGAELLALRPGWEKKIWIVTGGALVGCMVLTSLQITYWRSDLALFFHAVEVSPDSYVAANCLGRAFANEGDKSDALMMYGRAVKLEPRFPQTQFNYALSLFDAGRNDEAIDHLKLAADLEKGDADIQQSLGIIFAQHNSFTNACNCFSNAVSIHPDSAGDHFYLASTLANLGQFAPAAVQFREALRLKPEFPEAEAQYKQLLTDHPEVR